MIERWEITLGLWTEDGDGQKKYAVVGDTALEALTNLMAKYPSGSGMRGDRPMVVRVTICKLWEEIEEVG